MTTRLTLRMLLALLLCCGMLLSACGNDDDDDAGDATTASEPTITTTATDADGAGSPEASATSDSVAAEPSATVAEVETTSTTAPEATPTEAAPEPTETEDAATSEPTESITPDNSSTETATTTGGDATTTPGAPATATIETGGDPALAQLVESFVSLDDLPEGWAFWDTGEDDDNEDDNICGIPNLKDQFPAIARAEVSYQESEAGPFLTQSAAALSMADAEAAMALLEDAFAGCDTWTDPDGVVYTLAELPFPELGDAAITRRVSAESGGFSLVIEVAYIRDRSFVLALAHYGVDEIDSALTEEVARTVLDRLAEVEAPE